MPDNKDFKCSFCGKPKNEIKTLIAGPNQYICNECIDLCHNIIHEVKSKVDNTDYASVTVTPEEIKDAVVEMILRTSGKWNDTWFDDEVRYQIESIYSESKLNGKILSRFGTVFLKENLYLLEDSYVE